MNYIKKDKINGMNNIKGNKKKFNNKLTKRIKFPPLGLRIIKSAIAVLLCLVIFGFFDYPGAAFYSAIAALWCMQPYNGSTKVMAIERLMGTVIGAFFGYITLMLRDVLPSKNSSFLEYIIIAVLIALVLYTATAVNKTQTAYFATVVFLGIALTVQLDSGPFIFVIRRVIETIVGIILAIIINNIRIPRRKNVDTLFVTGLDGTLLYKNSTLTPYSKVLLNRMLEKGMKFTVSTIRTPAAIVELLREVNINMPVIAMDGSVLYDIAKKEYIKVYIISKNTSEKVEDFLEKEGFHYFINSIMDNVLMIYHGNFHNEAEEHMFRELRKSPYRNYVHMEHYGEGEVVYIMVIDKTERIKELQIKIINEFGEKLKVRVNESSQYDGYSNLRIFNKNASKQNMIKYLQKSLDINKVLTFGSDKDKYDVVINEYDRDKVVKRLGALFEPFFWQTNISDKERTVKLKKR